MKYTLYKNNYYENDYLLGYGSELTHIKTPSTILGFTDDTFKKAVKHELNKVGYFKLFSFDSFDTVISKHPEYFL